jgi:hypothetical protein
MTEVLFAPNREHVVTTNAWAFLHWLRVARGVDLAGWAELLRYSVDKPVDFWLAVAAFAGLSARSQYHLPAQPDLAARVKRPPDVPSVASDEPAVESPAGGPNQPQINLSPTALLRPVADTLLHADVRPDDRLLVCGPAWPWRAAELNGAAVVMTPTPADLLTTAAAHRATMLVAPATALAEAAFQRPRRRPDLSTLRTIVATGGPLSPEGRRRIYTWVKPDLMLLARTGDTFWGNPLEPVLARPPATPAFLMPPPSDPATR